MKQLLFCITLLSLVFVHAQEDTTKMITLEGVSVTGVRADNKTPVTETTLGRDDIKTGYQGEEVSQVLDKTPSITSSTDGGHPQGYTYFRIRGIDQTRINMTLNGVPLNEPEDQGVYFSNYPGFSNNIQSMQIQRGVGTSTNGVSSYAGSINFESPSGVKEFTEVELGYGSFNTKRFNVSHSTGINDKGLAIYTNFSTFDTDGYKYNSGSKGYSFFMSGGYHLKNSVIKFSGFTGRSLNQMSWNAVSELDINADPRTNYNTPVEDDNFIQNFIQVQHTQRLGNKSLINTTIYYNRLDGEWDLDLNPLGAGTDVLNYQLASNFYGLMSNYKYSGDKLNANIGIHGNMYNREHGMALLPHVENRLYTNKGFKNELSGFMKGGYDIGKYTLFGDAQLRYVTFEYNGDVVMPDLNWLFFNPKAGVVFNYCRHFRAYASVGVSHREPTRNDMFMGEDNLISYSAVNPEMVTDYEVGFSYLSERFKFKSNLYFMDFKNEITLIGALGSNGLPLMMNVDKSFRSGIEIETSIILLDNENGRLTLNNNTNLSYNRINDNGMKFQPLYTPPVVSNAELNYKYGPFNLAFTAKYHSSSYLDFSNNYTTPSFIIYGGSIGYTYKDYTISGRVNNITSVRYYTNGYVVDNLRYFYVNAPLSGYITIKMSL